ncbi:MAG: thioredoxin family protein [Paramuribaculum sp.]|nr:thioredoxin family protein [Paramuribaculum sp.]
MKSLVETIKETVPTLIVFQHAGEKDAVEVNREIEELRAKYGSRANIISVDASHNGSYKVEYKIKEYPAYILFKEGQELMRESGKKSIAELEDMLTRAGVA